MTLSSGQTQHWTCCRKIKLMTIGTSTVIGKFQGRHRCVDGSSRFTWVSLRLCRTLCMSRKHSQNLKQACDWLYMQERVKSVCPSASFAWHCWWWIFFFDSIFGELSPGEECLLLHPWRNAEVQFWFSVSRWESNFPLLVSTHLALTLRRVDNKFSFLRFQSWCKQATYFPEMRGMLLFGAPFIFNTFLDSFHAASRAPRSCHSVSSCDRSSNFGALALRSWGSPGQM